MGEPSWSCDACTLINPASLCACDACGASRPARGGGGAAGGGIALAPSFVSSIAALTAASGTTSTRVNLVNDAEVWVIAPPSARPPLCDCMATEHSLFTLCLHCGKVLCERERGTSCSACGAQPGRRLLRPVQSRALSAGDAAAAEAAAAQAEADASAQKERLLHFDRTSAQRTTVIDDDNAYFAANSTAWLSPVEEVAAQEAEAAARRLHVRTGRGLRLNIDLEARQAFDIDAVAEEEARVAQLISVRASVAASSLRSSPRVINAAAFVPGIVAAAPVATFATVNFANPTLTGACASVYAALAQQRRA